MAGLFGMFDYSKPGKGVDKNAPQKKRFFLFFELFFRKLSRMVLLNLMYILFCLPIITIGPATVALMKILRAMSLEKPIFLWSDYVETFKKNFKQGFIVGLIDLIVAILLFISSNFYLSKIQTGQGSMFYLPLAVTMFVTIIVLMMNFYLLLMIPIVDLKLIPMIKNSFSLAILGIKSNIFTIIFVVTIFVSLRYIPLLFVIILYPTILFSFIGFIIAFNSYKYIEQYVIEPYYQKTGERRPDVYYFDEDFDDAVFEDIGTKEVTPKQTSVNKGKTIK